MIWNHTQQCQRDGSLDARSEAQLALAVAAQPSAPDTYREVRQQFVGLQTAEGQLDQVRVDTTALEADLAETEALQQAFGEMKTLRESWLLGRGIVTAVPPTIMQIVMAFFARGFGALLITLVLRSVRIAH